jgi:hypothetical protein
MSGRIKLLNENDEEISEKDEPPLGCECGWVIKIKIDDRNDALGFAEVKRKCLS